jgi:hypothetical protein
LAKKQKKKRGVGWENLHKNQIPSIWLTTSPYVSSIDPPT